MKQRSNQRFGILATLLLIGSLVALAVYFLILRRPSELNRSLKIREWLSNPAGHTDWAVSAGARCGNAPFLVPTDGLIGYLWGDYFKIGTAHQGIDIFGGSQPGLTPVVAVYDGYLTRLADWKSSVIIRIPSDPLQPGRQIWTYFTHMADQNGQSFILDQFPAGTSEVFVKAGALLGYQGDYSGDPNHPVGVHLHFSIVKDDGKGSFANELDIQNTYDPSPYLGLGLNQELGTESFPTCPDVQGDPSP
jgi:murein DD-endopeptidase MepM/ murein hydrolase activator NlpD